MCVSGVSDMTRCEQSSIDMTTAVKIQADKREARGGEEGRPSEADFQGEVSEKERHLSKTAPQSWTREDRLSKGIGGWWGMQQKSNWNDN